MTPLTPPTGSANSTASGAGARGRRALRPDVVCRPLSPRQRRRGESLPCLVDRRVASASASDGGGPLLGRALRPLVGNEDDAEAHPCAGAPRAKRRQPAFHRQGGTPRRGLRRTSTGSAGTGPWVRSTGPRRESHCRCGRGRRARPARSPRHLAPAEWGGALEASSGPPGTRARRERDRRERERDRRGPLNRCDVPASIRVILVYVRGERDLRSSGGRGGAQLSKGRIVGCGGSP